MSKNGIKYVAYWACEACGAELSKRTANYCNACGHKGKVIGGSRFVDFVTEMRTRPAKWWEFWA